MEGQDEPGDDSRVDAILAGIEIDLNSFLA